MRLAAPLFLGSLLETLAWLTIACYGLTSSSSGDPLAHSHTSSSIAAFVITFVWAYILLRVAYSPSIRIHARPPADILILLLSLGIVAAVDGAGRVYGLYIRRRKLDPLWTMGWWFVDIGIVCALICVIILTPLELPSERVDAEKIVSGMDSFGPVLRKLLIRFNLA